MIANPLDLSGRTILVTGASSGLGLGTARLVARLGGKVILVARDAGRLATALQSVPGDCHASEAFDLTRTEQIAPWMKELAERHGPIYGFVHSAGVLTTKPLRLLTSQDWDRAMKLNVNAGAELAKGLRQRGVTTGKGSIIFVSSVMGLTGQPGQVLYSATKGALVAMTRSMAVELAREQIRVNCVAPAVVMTGMTGEYQNSVSAEQFERIKAQHPLGLGRPEDVANAVAFLLADSSRWITGTTLVVDGGYTAQ